MELDVAAVLGILAETFPSKSEVWLTPIAARIVRAVERAVGDASSNDIAPILKPRWPMVPDGYAVIERPECNRVQQLATGRYIDVQKFEPSNEWAIERFLIPALKNMGAAPQEDWRKAFAA